MLPPSYLGSPNLGLLHEELNYVKGKDLPSHQLLWFLASTYLDPGFEPKVKWVFYPRINCYGS